MSNQCKCCAGLTGYQNLINSCYVSAVMQCFGHTEPLMDYIMEERLEEIFELGVEPIQGKTIFYFGLLVRQYWSDKFSRLRYTHLKDVLGQLNPYFAGTQQQDAEELINYFMNSMLADCNLRTTVLPPVVGGQTGNTFQDATVYWAEEKLMNMGNVIHQNFFYMNLITTTCGNCGQSRVRSEIFYKVTGYVPQQRQPIPLIKLLDQVYTKEALSALDCDYCQRRSDSVRATTMWEAPPVLIFQLARFGSQLNKIDTLVNYPITDLDMSSYCHPEKLGQNRAVYDLYGVVIHKGTSISSGHYIAYAKTSHGAYGLNWRIFDDHIVEDINLNQLVTKEAYILFYRKRGLETTV